jgi:hypothetical protein
MSYPSMGGGIRYFAFNATTGASIWNISRAGNTQIGWVPAYWNGQIYAGEFFEVTAMNATNPRFGTYAPPDSSTRIPGNRTAGQWLGYQITSSVAYADDLTGPKIYVGSDIGSIYCIDPRNMTTLSVFTAGGNVACSPAVWDGKMYVGTTEGKLYCFDDSPSVDFNIYAAASKGAEMWNNETITISGRLLANPMELEYRYSDGKYVPFASNFHPGLPNAQVQLSLTKPDGSNVPLTATTDQSGYFNFSYSPTTPGDWGWVVYFEGKRSTGLTYNEAYSEWNPVKVVEAPTQPTPVTTPTPTPTATPTPVVTPTPFVTPTPVVTATPTATPASVLGNLPLEYVAVAVVAVLAVVAVAAVLLRRKKTSQ